MRVVKRIARRQGEARTDMPGIIFLEIDGLALPVLRHAMRDGSAPTMARWIANDGYQLAEWEPDLSSQTGASQAGILLGSNENIPAFRWVEKETGTLMSCSAPADCAEIERRHAPGVGLLVNGGASRGNLLSGEADEVILTVSRLEEEKQANPATAPSSPTASTSRGRSSCSSGRLLEWTAAIRARAGTCAPAGTAAGSIPCCGGDVRDRARPGRVRRAHRHDARRPAVYATFASYDEVAHRDRRHLSQNRTRRDKTDLGSGEMHGSTTAARASISAAISFCGELVGASAFGKKVVVASMMGVDDIVRSEGMANANSNSLLSRSEMGGRTHFLLLLAFSESFLGQPNLQQILVQRKK